MTRITLGLGLVLLAAMTGCTTTVEVAVPPRIDLAAYETVGLIEFASNSNGDLERLSTQKFLQMVQQAQPDVRIVELGSDRDVLASVQRKKWDAQAIRDLKQAQGVDAIVIGRLEVEKAKPTIELSTFINTLSAQADVDASLSARLIETDNGATVWTNSSSVTATVAQADFNKKDGGFFGATDPEAIYGEMVEGLVYSITDDFRIRYETQRIKN